MAGIVAPGAEIERAAPNEKIARHRHLHAYAALVLRGGYVEAGDRGRVVAMAGDVLFHEPFEGHVDNFGDAGAEIINLPIDAVPPFARGRVRDPDAIVRLGEGDAAAAAMLLLRQIEAVATPALDWPDLLSAELCRRPVRLASWAADHGLTPSSVSRGFRLAYGVSPKRFRVEQCAAAAARAISRGARLADAGASAGFSDQSHMTRTLSSLYGATPGALRVIGKCVQYRGSPQT